MKNTAIGKAIIAFIIAFLAWKGMGLALFMNASQRMQEENARLQLQNEALHETAWQLIQRIRTLERKK